MKAQSEAVEAHLEAAETHLGGMDAHPGVIGTHPGVVVALSLELRMLTLEPWSLPAGAMEAAGLYWPFR